MARVVHKKNYTVIGNSIVKNNKISWKAKGIFLYLCSLPNDWRFVESELMTHATEGKDAFRSGVKELEKFGYLVRKRRKDKSGKFSSVDWIINENPDDKKYDNPPLGDPNSGSSNSGDPQLLSTNKQSTNKQSTNKGEPGAENQFEKDIKKYQPVDQFMNQRFFQLPMSVYRTLEQWVNEKSTDYVLSKLNKYFDKGIKQAKKNNIRYPVPYVLKQIINHPDGTFLKQNYQTRRQEIQDKAIKEFLAGE